MSLRNTGYYLAGIGFLALAKAKNILQGYSSPKPFDISDTERCIKYDIDVVEHWLHHLEKYTQSANFLHGKNVLELGPGSDFGVGIYLISKGCSRYNACDANDLMKSTPASFYNKFFEALKLLNNQVDIDSLRSDVRSARAGHSSRLNYVVRDDFNLICAFGKTTVDLVFSQAAFEHFDAINETVSQLSSVCKPGAILVAEIDLKTHSRWIRDKDPNNIYRYSSHVYNTFWFRGIPNRIRPFQYKDALERSGWKDISITPLTLLNDAGSRDPCTNKVFSDPKNQMDYLSIMLCATKSAT